MVVIALTLLIFVSDSSHVLVRMEKKLLGHFLIANSFQKEGYFRPNLESGHTLRGGHCNFFRAEAGVERTIHCIAH